MADGDLAYLTSLSEHPNRPGDVSNMNPDFASRLAAAIRQARAAGLPVGVMSGYRDDSTTGSRYDAGGYSSHGYGLASDISGLDGPNGKITNAWAAIAEQNGLHNPYGAGNAKEFNHWQLPPKPLEQMPDQLAALKAARATGDFQNVWSAYPASGAVAATNAAPTPFQRPGAPPAPINPRLAGGGASPLGGSHAQFIQDYARSIGLDPDLALGIANAEGLKAWSAKNPNAASTVDVQNGQPFSFGDFQLNVRNGMGNQAIAKGIDPRDPNQWQAADRFAMDQMKAGGVGPWRGDPVAAAYLKSGTVQPVQAPGPVDPSIIARGGFSPPIGGSPGSPGAPATPGTTLPGFGTQAASDLFTKGAQQLDKGAMHGGSGGQDSPGQAAAFQPVSARNVSPLLPMASQIYGNTLTSMATPLQWSANSPGQSPFANGPPAATLPVGTSLASLQQLQQMMAMYGDGGYG